MVGERLAAAHLRRRGWRPLARRLATRHAELDLVFRAEGHLVCVEVKTARRAARDGHGPGRRLAPARRRAQWRAAKELGRRLGLAPRLDLVEVVLGGPAGPGIRHTRSISLSRRLGSTERGQSRPPPGPIQGAQGALH